jgi:hypothetical protein
MTHLQIALQVTQTMDKTSDRYDLIWAIKEILLVSSPVLVTCRETIDSILDELYDMGWKGY